jgi:hypothetical protein
MRSLIILFFFLTPFIVHSQDIDKSYLKFIVKTLASDSMQGRYPGTDGIERAARFIDRSFREAGVADVRREEFTVIESGFNEVYLRSGDKKFFCPGDIMIHAAEHINTEVEKELVFAGSGTREELKSVVVKGRVVLVFLQNMRSSFDLSREAYKLGAFAVIVANPDNAAQFASISRTFKEHVMGKHLSLESHASQEKAAWDTLRSVMVIDVNSEIVPSLMKTSVKSLTQSVENKTIKDIPVTTIGLKIEFKTRPVRTANVIAHVPGLVDTAIVVSAHYDHMGQSGSEIFHGADDNASGTAAIVALAKEFSKMKSLKYSMTFVAMTGEEVGLLGSAYHTRSRDFDAKKVIFNLNIDMIGSFDAKHSSCDSYIYVIGHSNPLPMNEVFEQAAKDTNITLDYSENGTTGFFQRSDQFSFHKVGIPAVHLFSGLHPRYHKDADRWDTLDYSMLKKRVEFAEQFLEKLERKESKNQ